MVLIVFVARQRYHYSCRKKAQESFVGVVYCWYSPPLGLDFARPRYVVVHTLTVHLID